jgi:hypothetical protein
MVNLNLLIYTQAPFSLVLILCPLVHMRQPVVRVIIFYWKKLVLLDSCFHTSITVFMATVSVLCPTISWSVQDFINWVFTNAHFVSVLTNLHLRHPILFTLKRVRKESDFLIISCPCKQTSQQSCYQFNFICDRHRVQKQRRIYSIVIESFRNFPQSFHVNTWTEPKIDS